MGSAFTWRDQDTRHAATVAILVIVSGLIAVDVGEATAAGALLLAVGAAAAWISPVGAAAFTVAVVPFAFELHPMPGGDFSLLELGIVWSVIGVALRGAPRPIVLARRLAVTAVRYPWITVSALVLVIATLVSVLALSQDAYRAEALREVRRVILEPIAFAAVLLLLSPGGRNRAWLVVGLLAGGVVASLVALAQLFVTDAGVIADSVTRLTGPYSHPNNLALYLERIAALAVPLALLLTGRIRLLTIGCLGIMMLALALTFSRGGWIGFAAAVVVVLFVLQRYRWLLWMAIGGVIVAVPGAVLLRERIFDLGGASEEPTRFAIWRSTWRMILDHPLTGVGPDQFLYQYGRRYVEPVGWPERYTSHPHNIVLDFTVRLGVGGIAALATMTGSVVAGVLSGLRAVRVDPVRLGALGALVAGGVHGLIDNSFFLPDLSVLFWAFLVLLCVESDLNGEVRGQ